MSQATKGLEGVVAAQSKLGKVDGANGKLWYCGYPIEVLAEKSTFEEVAFLLLKQRLPSSAELEDLKGYIARNRPLTMTEIDILHKIPSDSDTMSVLRTMVSFVGHTDPDAEKEGSDYDYRKALRLIGKITSIITSWERIRNGQEPVSPKATLSTAGNILYMLRGTEPKKEEVKILDIMLILHAEHGLNASTFAARVATATLSDLYSAVTAAVGTLKGRLHGGANARVMEMLIAIGSEENAEAFVSKAFENHEKVMGMGHRVYKVTDPRAEILVGLAKEFIGADNKFLNIAYKVRDATHARKPNLYPNVDFFSGSIYYYMGIPLDLYTALFAQARVSGWAAHSIEQRENNRLIRPLAEYIGELDKPWIPIEDRK